MDERTTVADLERRLAESEARHRLLVESWAQAEWETDADGVVIADSPSWRAYTGQALEEWLGYGWLDAIHPDDRAQAERQWREAIAARGLVDAEFRLRAPGGGWRWTNVRAAPVLNAEGTVEKWAGMNIDIDVRKVVEAELRDSEELFRMLADAAPALIWRNDEKGENLFINKFFLEFTGKSAAAIHGEGWHTLVHPDDVEAYVADYLAAVRERRTWQNRNRIRRHDGQWRWFENYAQPLFGQDGSYRGHVGVSTNITSQVEGEAILRESSVRQAFLLTLSDALRAEPSADAVANRALTMLFDHLQLDRCYITYYKPDDDAAEFPYQIGNDTIPELPAKLRLSDFPEAYEQVREKTFVIEDDFETRGLSGVERVNSKAPGMRAMVASTLWKGERNPLSSLAAVSSRPRRWTAAEISIIEEAAERTWAAIERARGEAALRESEQRLRNLVEGVPQLVWRAIEHGDWTWASPQWVAFTGQPEPDSHHLGWLDPIHPDDRELARSAWDHAVETGGFEVEYRIRNVAQNAYRWFQTRATPVRDGRGEIVEWLGTSTDIHELRDLQERQKVLVAELQHRTRNLMGVVRATAESTLRSSTDLVGFGASFRDRLEALARVQGLLSRLEGVERITFDDLIRNELTAIGAINGTMGKVTLAGPDGVALRSSTVQTFALALHELATNAAKYGALAAPSGQLSVTWRLEREELEGAPWLHVEWLESGVTMPLSGGPPRGTGQGRQLIERALPYQLGARTTYVMGPDGVRCFIALPVSSGQHSRTDDGYQPAS